MILALLMMAESECSGDMGFLLNVMGFAMTSAAEDRLANKQSKRIPA